MIRFWEADARVRRPRRDPARVGLIHLLGKRLRDKYEHPRADKLKAYIDRRANAEGVSYRVHYNLACYWTAEAERTKGPKRADAVASAIDELKTAIERGGDLVAWAGQDPSLAWWTSKKCRTFDRRKFQATLAGAAPNAKEASTGVVDTIKKWVVKIGAALLQFA